MNLEDLELAKAINADLHTQPGTIILRLDRTKQFSTALADLVIRRLARINSKRYQVARRSVYRDQTNIINGLLSANLFTTLMPFRPLNDTAIWAFIADDAVMRKDNGTVVRTWGLTAPANAPTSQLGIISGPTGAYTAVTTEIRFDGTKVAHESNPSPTPSSVTLAAEALAIGDIRHPTDAQVNGFGVYRTVAAGTIHLLDARVAIPSQTAASVTFPWEAGARSGIQLQWSVDIGSSQRGSQGWEPTGTSSSEDANGRRGTYLWERDVQASVTTQTNRWAYGSTIADSALGAAVETDNDPPPLASWCTEFQEHAFLCRDAANQHYLWFSKRFRPESVPTANFLEVGNPDDPLQCALPLTGLLGVLARRTKYRVTGNSISGFNATEAISARGTPAGQAALKTERGIVFVARDGVFLTNLIQPDEELSENIAPLFFGETVNGLSPINWDAASTMAATVWKGRYYLAIPTGTNTAPDLIAVLSVTTKKWYFYDHPARSLFVEEDTDDLVAGFTDGFVYILEDGATNSVALDCETKDVFGVSPHLRKMFLWARTDIETNGATVTVELYVDGVLKRTVSVTGSRTRKLIAFPEGSLGYAWRIRFRYTGTTRVRVYGAGVIALPLEAA
ncbi:MAG: hypothetical protein A3E78_08235 [Alphaproteobacteria bacterium RIFCSPHIGHO2_12_FULL_63_12]|nr:MAG: hypothetical protein A3E78_08235 [Alphaproteobacteria bacterium RIFCSPHIGHO2_12_FULL_63_12]